MSLLLASKSAARQAMLAAAGVEFVTIDAPLDEEVVKRELRADGLDAAALAIALAERKAISADAAADAWVLGADQTLELADGTMLDKPASREDAKAQLRRMAGEAHQLHSGAALVQAGAVRWRHVASVALKMRPLSDAFLADYLDQEYEAVRWGVGGYRIEGPGAQLFTAIEGSHFVILGLPLLPLLAELRAIGLMAS
ncbi:Maf family protein [Allosphingosinicella indica]|uniref:Nucleoside triphosphate pyrophosphatase n=1 Tax=Allosphingosinicella indica TaxID=941907 RepID=A0A1X7G4D2_9SPHN|nr:Maf family protein [Allosphingosinicella indica]SMF63763.1 septum formation protein [Allosphingosinicella indica]